MRTYATGLEPRYGKGIEGIRQGTFHVMTDEIKKKKKKKKNIGKKTKLFI